MPKSVGGEQARPGGLRGLSIRFATAWGPPVAWMAILFVLSAWSGQEPSIPLAWKWCARKAAHFSEYCVLAALLFRALSRSGWSNSPLTAIAAVVVAGIYGISDETHQMYVSSRVGNWMDVSIDAFGAGVGAATALWLAGRKR